MLAQWVRDRQMYSSCSEMHVFSISCVWSAVDWFCVYLHQCVLLEAEGKPCSWWSPDGCCRVQSTGRRSVHSGAAVPGVHMSRAVYTVGAARIPQVGVWIQWINTTLSNVAVQFAHLFLLWVLWLRSTRSISCCAEDAAAPWVGFSLCSVWSLHPAACDGNLWPWFRFSLLLKNVHHMIIFIHITFIGILENKNKITDFVFLFVASLNVTHLKQVLNMLSQCFCTWRFGIVWILWRWILNRFRFQEGHPHLFRFLWWIL